MPARYHPVHFVRPSAEVDAYGPAAFTPGDSNAANWIARLLIGETFTQYIGYLKPPNKAAEELMSLSAGQSRTVWKVAQIWDSQKDFEPFLEKARANDDGDWLSEEPLTAEISERREHPIYRMGESSRN